MSFVFAFSLVVFACLPLLAELVVGFDAVESVSLPVLLVLLALLLLLLALLEVSLPLMLPSVDVDAALLVLA